jgi:branched-chain amino acid transport system ATP-binding protein
MADALAIISREHRNLGSLLICLESLIEDIEERHLVPDFAVFDLMFDYFASYLDRYHHPKEDAHLFRALRTRDPGAAAVIDALQAEHEREPAMLAKMTGAMADYRVEGEPAFQRFRNAAKAYIEFERRHAATEEADIFERARRHLTADDWAEINAAFQANDDPLFGDAPAARYRALFTEISARVPAPHGLGRPWPAES